MKERLKVQERIKDILIRELEIDPSLVDEVDVDTPLLGRGIGLDSMELLSLVTGIEQEFHVQVEDEEVASTLFQTLGTLTEFVLDKLRSS